MQWLLVLLAGLVVYWFVRSTSKPKSGNGAAAAQAMGAADEPGGDPGHVVADGEKDNWEGSFWEVVTPRNIKANLFIKYQDGAGSVTRRTIRIVKYGSWEGGALLWAYCELRKANRTFRTDRIIECADLETGEIIGNLDAWLEAR